MWRTDRAKYEQIVKQQVNLSKKDIPSDVDMAQNYHVTPPVAASPLDDDDFWDDSDNSDLSDDD